MLGISEPAGWRPVTSADRQTGVSDGKVDTQEFVRQPSPASQSSVGARPASSAVGHRAGGASRSAALTDVAGS